jgi:sensor domain CHASE-containing protein
MEEANALQSIHRCRETFDRELEHLTSFCTDWSNWDDTYSFILDANPQYVESNLSVDTFKDSRIDLIYFVNEAGHVVWGEILDPSTMTPLQLDDVPSDSLDANHPFWVRDGHIRAGLMYTSKYPMFVVAAPILPTAKNAAPRGTVVMARFITPSLLGTLQRQTNVEFKLLHADRFHPLPISGMQSNSTRVRPRNEDSVEVFSGCDSLEPNSPYVLYATLPRDIIRHGFRTIFQVWLSMLGVGGLMLLVVLLLLNRIVLRPLAELNSHAQEIRRTGVLSARLFTRRKDEIGTFARQFDNTVEQMLDTRSRLLEASYHAGHVEMAGHILHDLRNAMTPVTVQLSRAQTTLRQFPLDKLETARLELEKPELEPTRRRDVAHYMKLYHEKIASILGQIRDDVDEIIRLNSRLEGLLVEHDTIDRPAPLFEYVVPEQLCAQIRERLDESRRERLVIESSITDSQPRSIPRMATLDIVGGLLEFIGRSAEAPLQMTIDSNDTQFSISLVITGDVAGQLTFEHSRNPELHRLANTLHAMGGSFEMRPGVLIIKIPTQTS